MGIIIRPGTGANQIAHGDLLNRGAADSHPQAAITGLETRLTGMDLAIAGAVNYDGRITDLETDVGAIQTEQSTQNTNIGGLTTRMEAAETAIAGKSDNGHTHDDRYYTQSEVDSLITAGSAGDQLIMGRIRSFTGL